MPLENLIVPEAILPSLRVNGKKQALQELSEKAAEVSGLPAREIFDAWMQREKLNSTGLGDGIAIPHGKLLNAPRIFGIFARLERPIDFESLDGQPVDLLFALIAPEIGGRGSFEGAGDHRPPAAQSGDGRQDPGDARGAGALLAADPGLRFLRRGVT